MTMILGVDPGSRITGYGVINVTGSSFSYVASGSIKLEEQEMAKRLCTLYDCLFSIVREYAPDAAAIEQAFVGKNSNSALKLGQARGVAMLIPSQAGIPVFEYAPRAVKQAITGSGAADKIQVQSMVKRLLSLNQSPATDAADALGVALCHAFAMRYQSRIGAALSPLDA